MNKKELGPPIDIEGDRPRLKRNVFSGLKKLKPFAGLSTENLVDDLSEPSFQAIGYDNVGHLKEPIHVMYLPDRTSEERTSISSNGASASSLDPKGQSLAEIGLNLAGYGLDHELTASFDLAPPPVRLNSMLSKSRSRSFSKRVTSPIQHTPVLHSPKQAPPKQAQLPILSFNMVSNQMVQMPKALVVEYHFERLLSKRVLPEASFKNTSLRRKWELVLREWETSGETPPDINKKEKRIPLDEGIRKHKMKDGLPEWFVSRIMSNKLTLKEYRKLDKKLLEPRFGEWKASFVAAQGETALSVILTRINKKSIKSNEEFDKEYQIVRCLRSLLDQRLNNRDIGHVIKAIMFSLISPRLATRILVTEVLIYLAHESNDGHEDSLSTILDSMYTVQDLCGDGTRFQPWLNSFEDSLDLFFTNRGQDMDLLYTNYSLTTLLLINMVIEGTPHIKKRIGIRRELNDARLLKVFDKLRVINDDRVNDQIERYEASAEEDYTEFFNLGTQPHEAAEVLLAELLSNLEKTYQLDDEVRNLRSIIQKFFMLKDSGRLEHETTKLLTLIDSVMQHIVAESTMIGSDAVLVLNSSIQRLMDRMTTEDTARRAVLETKELERTLQALEQEKKELEIKASFGLDETLSNLKKEHQLSMAKLTSQERQIESLKIQIRALKDERQRLVKEVSNAAVHQSDRTAVPYEINTNSLPYRRRQSVVSELETVYSARSEKVIDLLKDDFVNSDEILIISENYTRKGDRLKSLKRSPALKSLPNNLDKDPNLDQIANLDGTNNEPDNLQENQQPKVAGPPPPPPPLPPLLKGPMPPPPPPLPTLLKGTMPPPPPPPLPPLLLQGHPPPPPMPSMLKGPPPPPMPSMLKGPPPIPQMLKGPPPPPIPGFMSNPATPQPESDTSGVVSPPMMSGPTTPTKDTPAPIERVLSQSDLFSELTSQWAVARPKQKLKQMHWDKIHNIHKTFWNDIQHEELSEQLLQKGVLQEVEKAFVAKLSVIKKKKETKVDHHKVSFLPRDLAQQFGINLHMFANLSAEDLIQKILQCDRDILDNISVLEFFNGDSLNEISDTLSRHFLAYSTDFTHNNKPTKPPDELDRPDRIFLEIFNMRSYWKLRLRGLLLIQTYQKDYLDLLKKLQTVDEANRALRALTSLKYVLGIIRLVGNFMNDFSKQAMGFKLDTLQRLKFMKDDLNSMTFLHYVEKVIRNEFPEFGLFVDDLSALNHMNIVIDQLESDCQEFGRLINNVLGSILKGNLSDPLKFHPDDQILSKLVGPLESAKIKNTLLQGHLKRTMDEHTALMEYFGENAGDGVARNSFFTKFSTFVAEFKKAHVENIQKEEDQRAYEARKRLIEERAKPKAAQSAPAPSTPAEEDDDEEQDSDFHDSKAVIDSLLERLKSLAPTTKDRTRKHNRSKALSFYSTMSLDDLLLQVPRTNEYESVNLLKRRMTRRKNSPVDVGKTDEVMLRAQAMLSQLRNENVSNESMSSVDSRDRTHSEEYQSAHEESLENVSLTRTL